MKFLTIRSRCLAIQVYHLLHQVVACLQPEEETNQISWKSRNRSKTKRSSYIVFLTLVAVPPSAKALSWFCSQPQLPHQECFLTRLRELHFEANGGVSSDEVDGTIAVCKLHVFPSRSMVQLIMRKYGIIKRFMLRLSGMSKTNELLEESIFGISLYKEEHWKTYEHLCLMMCLKT